MGAFLERVSNGKPVLWLDYADYAGALLAGGRVPWLHTADYVAFLRKAQGLLRSDAVVLDLRRLTQAWLDADPSHSEALAARRRALYPVKTLLAHVGFRAQAVDLAAGLRASFADMPLLLALPSPRAWPRCVYAQAFGSAHDIVMGADEIDTAAVYIADFLRSFGDCGVDGLLLVEDAGDEPAEQGEIAWYQPVLNLAAHYRWDVGVQLPTAAGHEGAVAGVHFLIAPRALGSAAGVTLPASFWTGAPPPVRPAGGFLYAKIPADARPEAVLDRLASLR